MLLLIPLPFQLSFILVIEYSPHSTSRWWERIFPCKWTFVFLSENRTSPIALSPGHSVGITCARFSLPSAVAPQSVYYTALPCTAFLHLGNWLKNTVVNQRDNIKYCYLDFWYWINSFGWLDEPTVSCTRFIQQRHCQQQFTLQWPQKKRYKGASRMNTISRIATTAIWLRRKW